MILTHVEEAESPGSVSGPRQGATGGQEAGSGQGKTDPQKLTTTVLSDVHGNL
jgi:hypothetical protein